MWLHDWMLGAGMASNAKSFSKIISCALCFLEADCCDLSCKDNNCLTLGGKKMKKNKTKAAQCERCSVYKHV